MIPGRLIYSKKVREGTDTDSRSRGELNLAEVAPCWRTLEQTIANGELRQGQFQILLA